MCNRRQWPLGVAGDSCGSRPDNRDGITLEQHHEEDSGTERVVACYPPVPYTKGPVERDPSSLVAAEQPPSCDRCTCKRRVLAETVSGALGAELGQLHDVYLLSRFDYCKKAKRAVKADGQAHCACSLQSRSGKGAGRCWEPSSMRPDTALGTHVSGLVTIFAAWRSAGTRR
jgi:hypothetical protein